MLDKQQVPLRRAFDQLYKLYKFVSKNTTWSDADTATFALPSAHWGTSPPCFTTQAMVAGPTGQIPRVVGGEGAGKHLRLHEPPGLMDERNMEQMFRKPWWHPLTFSHRLRFQFLSLVLDHAHRVDPIQDGDEPELLELDG